MTESDVTLQDSNIDLQVAVFTRRGSGRQTNQDRAIVNQMIISSEHPDVSLFPVEQPTLVAVSDGLGGHPAGHVASALAADAIGSAGAHIKTEHDVVAAVEEANRSLYRTMFTYPSLQAMGATVAGVFINDNTVVVFHVGDSRVYFQSGQHLQRVTVDDWEDGYITQTLGGWDTFHPIDVHTSIEPFPADGRVLIATDGLFGMVDHEEMAETMRENPLETVPEHLYELAVRSGNTDDCTMAIIEPVPTNVSRADS